MASVGGRAARCTLAGPVGVTGASQGLPNRRADGAHAGGNAQNVPELDANTASHGFRKVLEN
jgi:hypothetical protein